MQVLRPGAESGGGAVARRWSSPVAGLPGELAVVTTRWETRLIGGAAAEGAVRASAVVPADETV